MQIQENFPLTKYNTFGINASAARFAVFSEENELAGLIGLIGNDQFLVLGGGSNILLVNDISGWVVKNEIKGIVRTGEDEEYVYVKAGAGENWHSFVRHCILQGWGGLENLSLIPGCVGASPMQNIGAYGVEIKDVFHELNAYHIRDKTIVRFTAADCAFGYRESVFKRKFRGQFVILDVTYRLRKRPVFNTSYGAIEAELKKMGVVEPSLQAISDAVIHIRSSKLPDPARIGNAGSFFKNPSVPAGQFDELKLQHPGIVAYPNPDGSVKLAAGWLIEQCGWKGYREGDAGVHVHQALVLVNYGQASGKDILLLSENIMRSVQEKFGVELEREVNIV